MNSSAGSPTAVTIEGTVRRVDGTVEELGTIAYWHRNPVKRILGQRHVRGSSILKALTGRAPRIEQHQQEATPE